MKFVLLIAISLSSLSALAEYMAYDGRVFFNLEQGSENLYYTYFDGDEYGEFDHALSFACSHPNFSINKIIFPLNKYFDFQIRAASNLVSFGLNCPQWHSCMVFSDFYVASGSQNTISVVDDITYDNESNFISYGYYETTKRRRLVSPQDNLNDHSTALFKVDKSLLQEGLAKLDTESVIDISVSIKSWDVPENSTETLERPLFTEKSGTCTLSKAKHRVDQQK